MIKGQNSRRPTVSAPVYTSVYTLPTIFTCGRLHCILTNKNKGKDRYNRACYSLHTCSMVTKTESCVTNLHKCKNPQSCRVVNSSKRTLLTSLCHVGKGEFHLSMLSSHHTKKELSSSNYMNSYKYVHLILLISHVSELSFLYGIQIQT